MRLHILSDLHMEFKNSHLELPRTNAQALILAGDINCGSKAKDWILELSDKYEQIFYLPGNHEFYGQNYKVLRTKWKEIEDNWNEESYGAKIHLFDPGSFVIPGYTFIGATLWTDFKKNDPAVHHAATSWMNDYRRIGYHDPYDRKDSISTWKIYQQHLVDKEFITKKIHEAEQRKDKIIVFTHHAPSYESVSHHYRSGDTNTYLLNYCYHSDLDELVARTNLWVHGHTHHSFDYKIGKSRVICNPRGYVGYEVNPDFDPGLTVEI